MNYSIVHRLLSLILATLVLAFLACLTVSFLYANNPLEKEATRGWITVICVVTALTTFFVILGKNANDKLFHREALATVGLGWFMASIIGALPYTLILPTHPIINALFESTSGLTTTGATVFRDVEQFPPSLLFWRSLSQWIGGLGVIVLFVAIISSLGVNAKMLYTHEASSPSNHIKNPRIQKGVLQLLLLYLGLSIANFCAYFLAGMNPFEAICHMFTTISTGGYSIYNQSLQHFQSPLIEMIALLFMGLGGTSFLFLACCIQKKQKSTTEVFTYYSLLGGFALLLTFLSIDEMSNQNVLNTFRHSFFQTVSIMTTTGYSSTNYQSWVPATHMLLITLMIIGGCSGSTAGGVKVFRLIAAIKISLVQIEKTFRSHVIRPLSLNGCPLKEQRRTLTFLVLVGLLTLISLSLLSVLEQNLSFEGVFSAIPACFFNIGPGFNEFGPTETYHLLGAPAKMYLCLLMIMGRLELYAVLTLFVPSFWKRFS